MTTAKLKANYEKHLEANWTREGERREPLPSQYSGDVCARCGVAEERHNDAHSFVSNRGFYKWLKEKYAN